MEKIKNQYKVNMNLGQYISETRKKKNISLRIFLLKTKISPDYLLNLEKGVAEIAPQEDSFYFLLKKIFKLSEEEFIELIKLKKSYKKL